MRDLKFIVQGFVRFADGYPARGIRVVAFDRDLRSEQPLGQAETTSDGSYRIEYGELQFRRRERGTADLMVKAYDAAGELLSASPVRFNAPSEATIDLTIDPQRCAPPALFEKISEAVRPLLGDVTLPELEEDDKHQDLSFIAGETGFEAWQLARFVLAHRLPLRELPPEFWFGLLGGSLFEYSPGRSLRSHLDGLHVVLPGADSLVARKALTSAIARGDLRAELRERVNGWIDVFLRLVAGLALGDKKSPTFLGHAAMHANLSEDKRERLARLYVERRGLLPQLLDELEKEGALDRHEAADLRTSYQLAELTGADFSVVRMLKEHFDVRDPERVRDLARHADHEWVALFERKVEEGTIRLPVSLAPGAVPAQTPDATVYAATLAHRLREAFPTAAFAGGLQRTLDAGKTRGLRHAETLQRFLDRHDDFDLLRTPIDVYLDEKAPAERRALARDGAFRRELKAVQRLYKLAPTFEAVDELLADDVHSAQAVYRMGESEFVRRYTGRGQSAEEARRTYRRAAEAHAAALTVVGELRALDVEGLPLALQTGADLAASFPNYRNLFQSGDLCHCEHCRSVLGPAAYFADLLMFLKDRRARNPAVSARDILFVRRPDIGWLELGCENANTTLPYVDIVCEVLERAIAAGEGDIALTGFTAVPTDPAAAKAAVLAALVKAKLDVGAVLSVTQVAPADPDHWVAHGELATYLLKKKGGADFFAEVLPNTKTSSAELRASPANVNPAAYAKLRAAAFPFGLPFDLFGAEVRAAFATADIARWDLMRTLRGKAGSDAPTDTEIAAEYFGISSDSAAPRDERRLITIARTSDGEQQEIWGEPGNASWLTTVSRVKTFLDKIGLEYEELLGLLDLQFINETGDLRIHHLDASCDTDQKLIHGLTVAGLDRIHRFLRMWRKLDGWKVWELDFVLRHKRIGGGTLDDAFLVALCDFDRLWRRLGGRASVEELCALLGDLNLETRFTALHERRADGLYHRLFLDRTLIQPTDPAFEIAAVNVPGPTTEKLSGHRPVILAALGVREADLAMYAGLTRASDDKPYITDDLTLANLSFLWRHATLARLLKFKAVEWRQWLRLRGLDVAFFASPRAALDFVEQVDHLRASGFSPDLLSWLLAADRTADAAVPESDAARFLAGLRTELRAIHDQFDPTQHAALNPPADIDTLTAMLGTLLQQLHRDELASQRFIAIVRDELPLAMPLAGLPAAFTFPKAITDSIPVRYDAAATSIRFTGLMTAAQKQTLLTDPSLAAVTVIPAYQEAVSALFDEPRLALKLLEPVFVAPLAHLPAAVDFNTLADQALARKVAYDPEERALRVSGILTETERAALDALSGDAAYRNAVNNLFTRPRGNTFAADQMWLQDADLKFPLRDLKDAMKDNLQANLVTAVKKALAFLARTQPEIAAVDRVATQLGLGESLTRRLLSRYAILPDTLLAHLTGPFLATSGVVDHATLPSTFDGWYWAHRVAALWKHWRLAAREWEPIVATTASARLLDFAGLPLTDAGPIAPLERLLRTSRLIRLRDSLSAADITLVDVVAKLVAGDYTSPALFAAAVAKLNEAWPADDVVALTASLDLSYPIHYALAETWERMERAFQFAGKLNAGIATARTFVAATMTDAHTRALKQLLRAKLGVDAWLTLNAEIQDALRERKRTALASWLLAQPRPADVPTGKWNSTNDLYAYYLLDVEMCACQLTSRLVQASGSVQLFVQRCFMGLEPQIQVRSDGIDGDSAWRWWQWMRKYRVWEANRKVFLWPENWIEPELKKDRSPFFKDLENYLLQNEVDVYTAEAAFAGYLEKLDSVGQLEIAGFYQEDAGDDAIVHVFGRTRGAEPHLYYYRRYDYRQWTPWEKVELDIQGDYLIPAVVNRRLFLFWPVFTEVPDESSNRTVDVPSPGESSAPIQPAWKRLRLQMAVSDYRQGKWSAKRVSTRYDESGGYTAELTRKHYVFYPVDRSAIDGSFGVHYHGYSVGYDSVTYAFLHGAFEVSGCSGTPESAMWQGPPRFMSRPEHAATGESPSYLKWQELPSREDHEDDLALESLESMKTGETKLTPVLAQTPGIFRVTPGWHPSYFDRLLDSGLFTASRGPRERGAPIGTWLPFFFDDQKRSFFVLPCLPVRGFDKKLTRASAWVYYPTFKREVRKLELDFEGQVRAWVDSFDFSSLTSAERQDMESRLRRDMFVEEALPYTDARVRDLLAGYVMRFIHAYLGEDFLKRLQAGRFHFKNFYHPFVCDFARIVHDPLRGIPGLMKRDVQLKDRGFNFGASYQPTAWVVNPLDPREYPRELVDFSPDGAYSPYNWELFFHIPLLIANSLSKNQRFEEARDWYHYIFNPIGVESAVGGGSSMSKYWITKPFFEATDSTYLKQRIENMLQVLAGDTGAPGYSSELRTALEGQVRDWRTYPFEPHRIANYRTVAYQKTVFMKYLDNLIAWGDYLFRQDSMESINEATQLYVLAAELLGPRPRKVPPQASPPLQSFNELERHLDDFSSAVVELENLVPTPAGVVEPAETAAPLPMLYFCVPHNEKLLGYWDTVADRLYKIRHCMNIDGVVRQLALFEPPIDPGALVKAIAGGLDLGAALADLNAPLPLYRFKVLLSMANGLCADVKALGAGLLAALEKKDAEALGLLRQTHEIGLLDAVKKVRELQIDEAKEQLAGLKKSRELITIRRDYYRDIAKISAGEQLQQDKLASAYDAQQAAQGLSVLASVAHIVPTFDLGISGFGGSPKAAIMFGGPNVGSALQAAAGVATAVANRENYIANKASINAGHERRWEDWKLQERLADKELAQLAHQIVAAEKRVTIAEKELTNHGRQSDNAREVDAFMRSKYTNQELYQWQTGQISGLYFQSFRLAQDLAKRAERCLRFELGLSDSSYIGSGQWDSLKKGLLAGEKLQYDLRRLETAYLELDRRELELFKQISLVRLDPHALVLLRETGRCFFDLPEELFDLDYPGHYFRRIKSVSVTLPCVAGPYTTISATLRLLKNSVRINTKSGDDGYRRNTDDHGLPADDGRFVESNVPVKVIATSSGQNDSGVFELNFRDERYLPFEGAGVVSTWSLELFTDARANNPDPAQPDYGRPLRQFDYESIADAVLHVKYTAREDVGPFKNGAITHLREHFASVGPSASKLLLDLRRDFPTRWSRFLRPIDSAAGNVYELELTADLFPLRDAGKTLVIDHVWLFTRCTDEKDYTVTVTPPLPVPPPEVAGSITLQRKHDHAGLHVGEVAVHGAQLDLADESVTWRIKLTRPGGGNLALDPEEVEDAFLVLRYAWA